MTRRLFQRTWWAALALFLPGRAPAFPPAQLLVGPGKKVTVRFRQMDRKQLIDIVSGVMLPAENTAELKQALDKAESISMVLTTEAE